MSVTKGGHCTKPLKERRQLILRRRLRRDRRRLLDVKLAAFAPPGPDRAFKVGGIDDDAQESRIRAPDRAPDAPRAPFDGWRRDRSSERCALLSNPRNGRNGHTCLRAGLPARLRSRTGGQSPLACYHVVARKVPPEIIVQFLGAAVDLPAAENIEGFAVHDEDAGRAFGAVFAAAAERADVNAFRPAMDSVGPGVSRLLEDLLGLDDFVDLRLRWDGASYRRRKSGMSGCPG